MDIFDYLRRVNTVSFNFPGFGFGIQLDNSVDEDIKKIARDTITFLEDRRVLFVVSEAEVPKYCIQSVDGIRNFLTITLSRLPMPKNEEDITDLEICLREMRAACQMMMTSSKAFDLTKPLGHNSSKKSPQELDFIMNIIALRSVFALNIHKISKTYEIPIREPQLKIIIDSYVS